MTRDLPYKSVFSMTIFAGVDAGKLPAVDLDSIIGQFNLNSSSKESKLAQDDPPSSTAFFAAFPSALARLLISSASSLSINCLTAFSISLLSTETSYSSVLLVHF